MECLKPGGCNTRQAKIMRAHKLPARFVILQLVLSGQMVKMAKESSWRGVTTIGLRNARLNYFMTSSKMKTLLNFKLNDNIEKNGGFLYPKGVFY